MHSKTGFEYLKAEAILAAMPSEDQKKLKQLAILDTVDSTSTYLLRKAKEGAPSGCVCLAENQTNGRGRLGRTWVSQEGNIYASILWRFDQPTQFSGLSIAVAVMLVTTLRRLGLQNPQLKWPNDVLINNRKLAGILLESNGPDSLVIGIGLNIKNPPEELGGIGLESVLDKKVDRNFLTGLLLEELFKGLERYQQTGLKPFLLEWEKYDCLRGKEIALSTPTICVQGIVQRMNEKGELILLDSENNFRQFSYGETSVLQRIIK